MTRHIPLLRYAALCLVLLGSAGLSFWSLERGMWFSLGAALAVFFTAAALVHRLLTAPLRALHHHLLNRCPGGPRETARAARFPDKLTATQAAIDGVLEHYRAQIFSEAERGRFYELVLDRVHTAVVACTAHGRVEWMNRSAEEGLGMLHTAPEEWMRRTDEGERVVHIERHHRRAEYLLTPIPFRLGDEQKWLFTLRDIRHVLEVRQQESWNSLSRVLTHEIMNSMTPILSLADTLTVLTPDGAAPDAATYEKMRQGLRVIKRRGQGLLDFVDNYRSLTNLPPPQPTLIGADELFADLRRLFPAPHIDFDQPYKGLTFRADRTQLEQVLINLIKNACEAGTRPDSPVSICLARHLETGEVLIHVQDHGRGIPDSERAHIFVPFYTTKPGGSGIGLSLCRQILTAHGGDLQVHSVPGRGSCFTVHLPDGEG